jgi:hypothetical protein
MTRKALHLGGGLFLTALGAFVALQMLSRVSPQTARLWQYLVLYTSFFVFLTGLALIFGYLARLIFWKPSLKSEHFQSTRRQAVLFGFLGIISLMLLALGMLNLLTAGLLLLFFVLIELYSQ